MSSRNSFTLKRRGMYRNVEEWAEQRSDLAPISPETISALEEFDLYYRALCAVLYNFAGSGHPGGSLSSGRFVAALLLEMMDWDIGNPDRTDADRFAYAAGHKALGLYAMLAALNELTRCGQPGLLPKNVDHQVRLYDLLGFRHNPTQLTDRMRRMGIKRFSDGHPTPATPFVPFATGASGVGLPAALGLALGAFDMFGMAAPNVFAIEGEGGLTPGRVAEAMAAAATAQLRNFFALIDWNNASIDTNHVCPDGSRPGQYVQWTPAELFLLHDWNVVEVPDGHDFVQILQALRLVRRGFDNDQPTAIIFRTQKGFGYGYGGNEPRLSHGAGHPYCSAGYYAALQEFETTFGVRFPRTENTKPSDDEREELFFRTLEVFHNVGIGREPLWKFVGTALGDRQRSLNQLDRRPRTNAPQLGCLYTPSILSVDPPAALQLKPGTATTLRAALGNAISHLNEVTGGAFIIGAADLYDSTSVSLGNNGFSKGFFNAVNNSGSRLIPVGGICEDTLGAFMAGLSSYGYHIGVTSSYAAFLAALEHVAMRLHCIGQQARRRVTGQAYQTFIAICAHAGFKTGEDGPTHADPQALQLLQGNFPPGMLVTLTPWTPDEVWPLFVTGLAVRPAVLVPFVTRPNEEVIDREAYGLPPASAAASGVYQFRTADPQLPGYSGTIILQGSAVMNEFVTAVLPRLEQTGFQFNCYYVSSAELFDLLPLDEQRRILPTTLQAEAMCITDFTAPTMEHWVQSNFGRRHSLSAFSAGGYPGSGKAEFVLRETGLDSVSQLLAIQQYAAARPRK